MSASAREVERGARGNLGARRAGPRRGAVVRRVHAGSVAPQSEQRAWSQTKASSRSFRRNRAPARPTPCSMSPLASPTDASLSAPKSLHDDRDNEPVASPAAYSAAFDQPFRAHPIRIPRIRSENRSDATSTVSVHRDPRIVGEDRGTARGAVHRSPARIWAVSGLAG